MTDLLAPFRRALIEYCEENQLDYEKIVKLPKCGNEAILFVQHWEGHSKLGLKDNVPAEIVIQIEKNDDNSFTITPGKNIKKYLAF